MSGDHPVLADHHIAELQAEVDRLRSENESLLWLLGAAHGECDELRGWQQEATEALYDLDVIADDEIDYGENFPALQNSIRDLLDRAGKEVQ